MPDGRRAPRSGEELDGPAAVLRRAAIAPADPWLFFSEGFDWPWLSFEEGALRLRPLVDRLASLPAGTRVGLPWRATPPAILADLAIQLAGHWVVPLPAGPGVAEGAARERCRGCGAILEVGPTLGREVGLEIELEVGLETGLETGPLSGPPGGGWSAAGPAPSGGAVILDEGTGEERVIDAGELAARARALTDRLGPPAASPRHIVVLSRPPVSEGERVVAAWALSSGAAVLLEPDPAALAATVHWTRPTLVHGSAAELAALAAGLRRLSGGRWRRRLPRRLRRLRQVLVLAGPGPAPALNPALAPTLAPALAPALAPIEAAFWERLGAQVMPLSPPGPMV